VNEPGHKRLRQDQATIDSPKFPRHLNCPRCGLSILVQPHRAAIRHCPRCVARSRVIVELFSSTLPADVLYDEGSVPRVDGELTSIVGHSC
jgi:transcription elongation factor Elf1